MAARRSIDLRRELSDLDVKHGGKTRPGTSEADSPSIVKAHSKLSPPVSLSRVRFDSSPGDLSAFRDQSTPASPSGESKLASRRGLPPSAVVSTDLKYSLTRSRRSGSDVGDLAYSGTLLPSSSHADFDRRVSPVGKGAASPDAAAGTTSHALPSSPLLTASGAGSFGNDNASPTVWKPQDSSLFVRTQTAQARVSPTNKQMRLARTSSLSSVASAGSSDAVSPQQREYGGNAASPLHRAMNLAPLSLDSPLPPLEDRTTLTLAMIKGGADAGVAVNARPDSPYKVSIPGARSVYRSADVSYMSDSVGSSGVTAKRGSVVTELLEPPASLIPTEFHVVQTAAAIPEGESPSEWTKTASQLFVKQLFPSIRPTGRHEAVMLTELLDKLLSGFEDMKPHLNPRDLVRESQKIHSVCMFEVVRQVSVHCVERGVLLKRIWEGYGELFESLWRATQDMIDAMKSHYEGVNAALRHELEALLTRLAELEELVRIKDMEIARLREEIKRLEGNVMSDEMRERMKELEDENARLLEELLRLKTAFIEMTTSLAKFKEEAETWKMLKDAADRRCKALEEENAKLKARLAELEAENGSLRDMLEALRSENDDLKKRLADALAALAAAQAQLSELQGQLAAALRALAAAKAQIPRQKETRDNSCQTDRVAAEPVVIVAAAPPPPEPEAEPEKTKRKKKKIKFEEATPWPLTNALKAIQGIYQDKVKADAVDDACHNDRQNMQEYVEDWFKNQYGTGPMLKEVQAKFAATLLKFKDSNPYCETFSRLWGLTDPLDEPWCDYYLEIFKFLLDARVSPEEIVLPTKNLGYMIKLKFLSDMVKDYFGKQLEARFLATFQMKLAAQGEKFGSKGLKYVEQERFMTLCLEERKAMFERMGKTLADLFVAGDTNGDGVLDIDEFTCIVRYVDPTAPAEVIERMHKEAKTEGSDVMTPDDFVRVCMDNGLLNTAAAKTRLQSEFEDADEKTNEELFKELHEKWEERRVDALERVARLTDNELKESLEGRIEHFTQLMEAGEEPEVASIARRLLMMELHKHTSEMPKAIASSISVGLKLKAWANRGKTAAGGGAAATESEVGSGGGLGALAAVAAAVAPSSPSPQDSVPSDDVLGV